MRATLCVLLLVLSSRVCAQTGQPPSLLAGNDKAPLTKLGETVPVRDLRIPPKAIKELQRSQQALRSGDTRSSAHHLEKALQIYPDCLEAHNNLGARYIELQEYEKAAAQFQEAIEIDPRVGEPFNNLSVAFFLLHRYADAETAARRALELDPHQPTARYMLGAILATEKRNPVEAMELLRQSKQVFPDSYLLLADMLARQGEIEEAQNELREYLALPGVEKKENVERWLARLARTSPRNGAIQPDTP
jgi:tetratricopeptide (TPR) repeat protein